MFATVVEYLKATITIDIDPSRVEVLREFSDFAELLLGITPKRSHISLPARLYRAGVTNAADKGLDIWANFGPAVQVKHISLKEKVAASAAAEVRADQLVLVCKSAEAAIVERVLTQAGFGHRIRGVITENHLIEWYEKCLRGRFGTEIGSDLLSRLEEELIAEFPHLEQFMDFFRGRGYNGVISPNFWSVAASANSSNDA